jgi:hypothetical protein
LTATTGRLLRLEAPPVEPFRRDKKGMKAQRRFMATQIDGLIKKVGAHTSPEERLSLVQGVTLAQRAPVHVLIAIARVHPSAQPNTDMAWCYASPSLRALDGDVHEQAFATIGEAIQRDRQARLSANAQRLEALYNANELLKRKDTERRKQLKSAQAVIAAKEAESAEQRRRIAELEAQIEQAGQTF